MSEKVVEFIVDGDGQIFGEVDGVQGPECELLMNKLIVGLGKVEDRDYKPEFDQREGHKVEQHG